MGISIYSAARPFCRTRTAKPDLELPFPRLRQAPRPEIALAGSGDAATHEGWVERVRRRPGRVDIELSLNDGSAAWLRLDPDDASWLEIEIGQILPVRRPPLPSDPGLPLVGECVHVGW